MSTNEVWVFGYGSLIWNPEFPFEERQIAELAGFQRRFCMLSIHHRGTPERPGLVLALDHRDESCCAGVAFRLARANLDADLERLRERELVSSAYVEEVHDVLLEDGRRVDALCYVVDRDHPQYVADQSLIDQATQIARSVGGRGPNPEYLFETYRTLNTLGIDDPDLAFLDREVRKLIG